MSVDQPSSAETAASVSDGASAPVVASLSEDGAVATRPALPVYPPDLSAAAPASTAAAPGGPKPPLPYARSTSKQHPIIRRLSALILSLLMMVLLLVGGVFRVADTLVGTPTVAADTFLSIVTVPTVSSQIAAAVVDDFIAHSSPSVSAVLNSDHAKFDYAIVNAINKPATQAVVRADVERAYEFVKSGTGGTLSLAPLVTIFAASLHQADHAIPVSPSAYSFKYNFTVSPNRSHGSFGHLSATAWALSIVGVLGAILVARFLVHARTWKLLTVGLVIGLPGLALFVAGNLANNTKHHFHYSSQTGTVVATTVLHHVGNTLAVNGVILMGVAAAVILGWSMLRMLRPSNRSPGAAKI